MPKQNTSYDNCISKLQSKYEDRGVKASAQSEAKVQIKREMSSPNAYFVSRMNRPSVAENYRNGEFNGQKYMTTGDFLQYYNSRKVTYPLHTVAVSKSETAQTKEFKCAPSHEPQVAQHQSAPLQQRANANTQKPRKASHFDPNARTIEMPSIAQQKGLRAKVKKFADKWFPKEDKKESTTSFKRIPVAMIGLIISSTIAMSMIIGSTVMASSANVKVSDLKHEVSALLSEEAMLEEKLTRKENLDEIKAYATENLGMISKDYVAAEYISISSDDVVVNHENEEKESVDFSTLLSAIFGE